MLKQIPERITYAQKKIIHLIEERKLRQWCMENGLQHASVYRLGIGELIPSYKRICSMVHLIAPIEWLFYTDEKLPYEPQIVPQWNSNERSKFVKEHKYDYKEVAKKYGITELSAYNICVAGRAKPSLAFIRECCKDTNPIDFFMDGEEPVTSKSFTPDRGDIVNIQGNILCVLSKKESTEKELPFSLPYNQTGRKRNRTGRHKNKGIYKSKKHCNPCTIFKMPGIFYRNCS